MHDPSIFYNLNPLLIRNVMRINFEFHRDNADRQECYLCYCVALNSIFWIQRMLYIAIKKSNKCFNATHIWINSLTNNHFMDDDDDDESSSLSRNNVSEHDCH